MQFRGIPRTVWVLGFVSMFMDISSEMIQSLLPLYLTLQLGVSAIGVGVIEGIAVATATVSRLGAGLLSDRSGNRKNLVMLGYGLGALSKPLVPLAGSLVGIVTSRIIDRVGKGIRSGPRDALIADVTPAAQRGASFGLRKSLDTVGGFAGPVIATLCMLLTVGNFMLVFWLAVIPAALSILLIAFGVREPDGASATNRKTPFRLRDGMTLNALCWGVIACSAVLTFARFSEAFLLLRSEQAGIPVAWVPLVLVAMHLIYGAVAFPVGVLSDRIGRLGLLQLSLVFLIAADIVLAGATSWGALAAGIVLWGLHMGFSQGILAALIADSAPAHLRATAFGMSSLVTGIAAFAGNVAAGVLWEAYDPAATFVCGAAAAGLSLLGLMMVGRKLESAPAG